MSELRRCPFTRRWVVIAPERRERPFHLAHAESPPAEGPCPLCPDGETVTPHVLWRDGDPWQVRVLPNGRPAVRVEAEPNPRPDGVYDRMDGSGAHEVIVEGRDHGARPWTDNADITRLTLLGARDRMRDLRGDARFRAVTWFKDQGPGTGARLDHPHSQLVALPVVPPSLARNNRAHAEWQAQRGRCLTCDVLYQELQERLRIVDRRDHFVAWAPFAPITPFETWIAPVRHATAFEATGDRLVAELADLLASLLRRLDAALGQPPLHAGLLSLPGGVGPRGGAGHFHWRVEVRPRLAATTAFELATGCSIHAVPPEESAAWLRGERG